MLAIAARSQLANTLHAQMGAIPLVLFYPGQYKRPLALPSLTWIAPKRQQANYYRAFQLVPHAAKYQSG